MSEKLRSNVSFPCKRESRENKNWISTFAGISKNGFKNIMDIVLPHGCIGCGKEIVSYGLCEDCKKDVHYIKSPMCTKCGKPFHARSGISHLCMDCIKNKNEFILSRSVFEYSGLIAELIIRFKFKDNVNLTSMFVYEMERLYNKDFKQSGIEALIPVPLFIKRLKQRTYNQSQLLTQELSKRIGIPYRINVLEKIKNTPPQSGLKGLERIDNVKGAYKIKDTANLKGKNVLLIDDVITTGSTIRACVSALKRSGIKRVYVMSIALVA